MVKMFFKAILNNYFDFDVHQENYVKKQTQDNFERLDNATKMKSYLTIIYKNPGGGVNP